MVLYLLFFTSFLLFFFFLSSLHFESRLVWNSAGILPRVSMISLIKFDMFQ